MKSIEEMAEQLDRIEDAVIASTPRLYTERQAATLLGFSERYMAKLRAENKITFVSVGGSDARAGHIRYTPKDLRDFADRHAVSL